MTPAELDDLVKASPSKALKSAADQLTPEQFKYCSAKNLRLALAKAPDLLTPKQLKSCCRYYPFGAVLYASHRLDPDQIVACARTEGCRFFLNLYLSEEVYHIPPQAVRALHNVIGKLDRRMQKNVRMAIARSI